MLPSEISVYSTCPESRSADRSTYLQQVRDAARWSEEVGCEGMLVYAENGLVDPWLVAQTLIQSTERLVPLVAVQPIYMHPYAVAKMIATLAYFHVRRVDLNLVAGGFRNDLNALGDDVPHDERYARLHEYADLVKALTGTGAPITQNGRYYRVDELRLQPAVPAELQPGFMMSGSSTAGLAAARAIGAVAVRYPRPADEVEHESGEPGQRSGVRIGIIARADREEAWRVAFERFPEDRAGQMTHHLAMSVSDSHWHGQLSRLALEHAERGTPYWLGPFQNYATFCPYLVGDYETIAAELSTYMSRGFDTYILDIPPSRNELDHAVRAFELAATPAP